jgi:hypothetical protein
MARKPSALARELLRNFPKGRRGRRRRRKGGAKAAESGGGAAAAAGAATNGGPTEAVAEEAVEAVEDAPDAAAEIQRAAAELNGARATEDEVADLFAEQQELGDGDLEGYSVDE